MKLRTYIGRVCSAVFLIGLAAPVSAQSLDPRAPTHLAPGENRGTLDCMVGPQYWSFRYNKGPGKLDVRFSSMGLFGNPTTATMNVIVSEVHHAWTFNRSVTSRGGAAVVDLPATFTEPGEAVIELATNGTCLVRAGGDYAITASGPAIEYGGGSGSGGGSAGSGAPSGRDRIVGTYAVMVCAPDFDCQSSLAIRFDDNGTVRTTDGHAGTWSVFDPDAMIYSVVMGSDRWSLKLVPGRGLFNTNDLSVVVFQSVRPR
jgi:hypothetical protein